MKESIPVELECEDEGWLNSPTCVECGWHPEDEGHDDDCPLSARDEGKQAPMNDEPEPYNDQEEPDYATDDDDEFEESLEKYLRYPKP